MVSQPSAKIGKHYEIMICMTNGQRAKHSSIQNTYVTRPNLLILVCNLFDLLIIIIICLYLLLKCNTNVT